LDVNESHYHLINNNEKQGKIMTRRSYGRIAACGLLLAAAPLLLPLTASAQDEARTWSTVRTIHVKPSMVPEFVELQKQLNEAGKAAGHRGRGVWQEIRGDLATFHVVEGLDNFAQYDEEFTPAMGEDEWDAWVDAIGDTIVSASRRINRTHPEYSIPTGDDSTTELLVLRTTSIAPGKGGDFHEWLEDKLVPALKSGGAEGVWFSHVAFGGSTDRWTIASRIDNWAELDEPGPLSHLSDEERAALFEGWGEMVWGSDVRIMRFRPDLSRRSPEE
jgi:antibiotic biosynthesis monooxygenase (ABM) superfamily enzyme